MSETEREHAWLPLLTERDREFFRRQQRYGARRGFGKRPVFMAIDMQYMATGDGDVDIFEMQERFPGGCGHEAWAAIRIQLTLLEIARSRNVPIIFTRYLPKLNIFDSYNRKHRARTQNEDFSSEKYRIISEMTPRPGEFILDKSYASAAFGTTLMTWLVTLGVDTVLISGNSTSGCVRATAVDLASYNFNVTVIEDAVFDRVQLTHAASLLDLWMKYADVVWADTVIEYLSALEGV